MQTPTFVPSLALPLRPRRRHIPPGNAQRSPIPRACASKPTSTPQHSYELAPGEIAVRFINTPMGEDIVAAANPGDPLLMVGDGVGVSIPRACQSGLCGSCTCDVVDAATGEKETVRACQTGVSSQGDGVEMVIDVERMKEFKGKARDPMKRFENMDTEYVARAAPRKGMGWRREETCNECSGSGDVECFACEGAGVDQGYDCALCVGTGLVRCAECQGKGITVLIR